MDERIAMKDPAAVMVIKNLNRKLLGGWTVLQQGVRGRTISNELTTREREVAKLAAFGLSNNEIADRLNISVNTIKQSLRSAKNSFYK